MGSDQPIRTGLARSFQFSGRATRSEFWWLWVFALIVQITIGPALDLLIFGQNVYENRDFAYATFGLLILISPALAAVNVRRVHDIGLPGLWAAIPPLYNAVYMALILSEVDVSKNPILFDIALIANLAVIVIALVPSAPRPNRYGPSPA